MGKYENFLQKHYDEIFKKYSDYELLRDISSFQNVNGSDLERVITHFFKEEIYKCRGNCRDRGRTNKTPIDFLNDENEIEKAMDYINSHGAFYTGIDVENLLLYIRKGPGVYTHIVSNFSPRTAKSVYLRYFNSLDGLNCLDTSCGFGSRMSSVLLSDGNYYGTDPNKSLYKKLRECELFYRDCGAIQESQVCDIRCVGSEVFIDEWESKMDVSFTSPPYFNYELYSDDSYASTSNTGDLREWVKSYVVPTVRNTVKYVKSGGYMMINSSDNVFGIDLLSIWKRCFLLFKNLEYVETFDINSKTLANKKDESYSESVIVFKKK